MFDKQLLNLGFPSLKDRGTKAALFAGLLFCHQSKLKGLIKSSTLSLTDCFHLIIKSGHHAGSVMDVSVRRAVQTHFTPEEEQSGLTSTDVRVHRGPGVFQKCVHVHAHARCTHIHWNIYQRV